MERLVLKWGSLLSLLFVITYSILANKNSQIPFDRNPNLILLYSGIVGAGAWLFLAKRFSRNKFSFVTLKACDWAGGYLILVAIADFHFAGWWCIFIGNAFNMLAVFANGGKMPVQIEVIDRNLPATVFPILEPLNHTLAHSKTKLRLLCDRFYCPSLFGNTICSIGDIFLWSGLILLATQTLLYL